MADVRLYELNTRWFIASADHFADFENPTSAELNANPDNDPNGSIFDLTCALFQDGSSFTLGDAEKDAEISFCQTAGQETATSDNPEVVFEAFMSETPWVVSDPATYNQANLAQALLAWRGVEYIAIQSTGWEPGTPFAPGQIVKMVRVATDHAVYNKEAGGTVKLAQNFLNRGDINWNYDLLT